MAVSNEIIWNKLNAIHDCVITNTKEIAVINERLNNHLEHQEKKQNKTLLLFGIVMTSIVGLLAILK